MSTPLPAPQAFIDTETISLDPGAAPHTAWEVGMIVRGHHQPALDGRWCWQLRVDADRGNPESLAICRYHERNLMHTTTADALCLTTPPDLAPDALGGMSRAQFAALFCELTRGAVWLGIVPDFDIRHLFPTLLLSGQLTDFPDTPWHYQPVDVEAVAAGRLGMHPPYDSDAIARAFGVDLAAADHHTALGDADYACRLYDRVMTHGHPPLYAADGTRLPLPCA